MASTIKRKKTVRTAIIKEKKEHFEAGLLKTLIHVKNGNFSVRMPVDQTGVNGKICDALNEIIEMNEKMVDEFTRAGKTIGKEGHLNERIVIPHAKGDWKNGIE